MGITGERETGSAPCGIFTNGSLEGGTGPMVPRGGRRIAPQIDQDGEEFANEARNESKIPGGEFDRRIRHELHNTRRLEVMIGWIGIKKCGKSALFFDDSEAVAEVAVVR